MGVKASRLIAIDMLKGLCGFGVDVPLTENGVDKRFLCCVGKTDSIFKVLEQYANEGSRWLPGCRYWTHYFVSHCHDYFSVLAVCEGELAFVSKRHARIWTGYCSKRSDR